MDSPSTSLRRRTLSIFATAPGRLAWLGLLGASWSGCADPCLDDGLVQSRNSDCPALAGGTDSDSAGSSGTAGADSTGQTGGAGCDNGVQDGDETDIDCGGSCDSKCGDGQGCGSAGDCMSGICADDQTCQPPSCSDGVHNGDETDVDCGGSCPADCADGDGCLVGEDCISTNCDPTKMTCIPTDPTCDDGTKNGDETDVDCGGSCPADCDDGQGCLVGDDCVSTACDPETMKCVPGSSCSDGVQNGDETDVDCGGSCPADCDDGEGCEDGDDCISHACDPGSMTCLPPACDDGVQNGGETDVDCGGACPADCDDGEGCLIDDDCISGACDEGAMICTPPACDDGVQNGSETDVDCGGACPTDCDDGEGCLVGDDCISHVCDPGTLTCTPPSCSDGVQNGSETDDDCGGSCGPTCQTGEDCLVGGDCIDDVCDAGTLTCAPPLTVDAAPSCTDYTGVPVGLTATASGGTGTYTYAWTPASGLDDATSATPNASPTGFETYTVTVDDGVNQASDTATVVNASAFDLQGNCTLYQGNFQNGTPNATITYSQGGTVACENGNNDFGLHMCEGVVFQDVRLSGVIGVSDDGNDDDILGLVWGGQDSSTFYSLSWKRVAQNFFGCSVPAGIVVKRVDAASFASLGGADVYCAADTANSTLLLAPASTTTAGWAEGQTYEVTIDFTTTGSTVTVVRQSDNAQITTFDVTDTTFTSGFFGSTTFSQINACVGPLHASCL